MADSGSLNLKVDSDNPAERSIQCVKSKGKWKLMKRPPTKASLKRRQYITDARRTYSQMLLNAFNSCDMRILGKIFNQYCTSDIITVSLYDGIQNPNGNNSTEMRSVSNLISLWTSLFKSAPDLLFQSDFLTAYVDPVARVSVVKSKFRMTATRVVDVKFATKIVEKERGTKSIAKYTTTDENELMAQIHEQLASSYCANNEQHVTLGSASAGNDADLYLDDALLLKEFDTRETFSDVPAPVPPQPEDLATQSMSSLSAETEEDLGGAPPKKRRKKDETVGTKLVEKEVHSSLFKQGNAVVAEGATIYSDATPLAESTKLSYAGTFTVYLNDENKICRYEFVYTTD